MASDLQSLIDLIRRVTTTMNQKKILKSTPTVNTKLESAKVNGYDVFVGMQVTLHKGPRRAGKYQIGRIELDKCGKLLLSVYQGNNSWHFVRPEAIKTVHVKTRAARKT